MNNRSAPTGIVFLAAMAALATIVAILIYTFQNETNHTGFNPYLTLAVFVPVSAVGILHLVFMRSRGVARLFALIATVTGITGVGLLVYLDQSNTLLQYDVWHERGMPLQNEKGTAHQRN